MFILFIYKLLLLIFSPIIYLYYKIRINKNLETKESIRKKFCFGDFTIEFADKNKKLVWIHAVSVGELNSAWLLIKTLNNLNKYNILITTSTITSAEGCVDKIKKLENNENIKHYFYPLDIPFVVNKFLNYFKPSLFINIESENWPYLLYRTSQQCKVVGINKKISERSFKRWMKFEKFKNLIFDCFDICLAQTPDNKERLILLGAKKVEYLGNLKFLTEKNEINEELLLKFKNNFENKPHKWLVNSTHKNEEEIIIKTHKLLKNDFNDIFTVIVLRHPNRKNEVVELLKKYNLNYTVFSENMTINDNTEIFLYDVIGGLGNLFELFKIVFMAGSLQENIGGHTPIEAIKQKCCTLTGPYIFNNQILFEELEKINGIIVLKNNEENTIYETIKKLLNNKAKVIEIAENAYRKTSESNSLIKNIVDIIENNI